MLTKTDHRDPELQESYLGLTASADRSSEQISKVLSALRRQIVVVVSSVAVCLVLAIVYLLQAIPGYTASTSLLIDSKQVGFSAVSQFEGAFTFDSGAVDSQVVLVESDRIAGKVIDNLDLLHNQEFIHPTPSSLFIWFSTIVKTIKAPIKWIAPPGPERVFEDYPVDIQRSFLVAKLQSRLKVTRNARTYVLKIDYSDPDPRLARSIAASYAASYFEDQLDSRFDTARRAATWLDERIAQIRAKAAAAGQAAQDFREKK